MGDLAKGASKYVVLFVVALFLREWMAMMLFGTACVNAMVASDELHESFVRKIQQEEAQMTVDYEVDTALGDLHCKPLNHLHVTIGTAAPTAIPTATYMPEMPCHQQKIGHQPGIVLSVKTDPLVGLHLLDDAVLGLPDELRAAAREASGIETVTLAHPINGVFKAWGSWTPPGAMAIADAIDAAWANK